MTHVGSIGKVEKDSETTALFVATLSDNEGISDLDPCAN